MACNHTQTCILRNNPLDNFYPFRLSMLDRKETVYGLLWLERTRPHI